MAWVPCSNSKFGVWKAISLHHAHYKSEILLNVTRDHNQQTECNIMLIRRLHIKFASVLLTPKY